MKAKRLSFSKEELTEIYVCVGARLGILESQAYLEDVALTEINKRLRPMQELQERLREAIQESK